MASDELVRSSWGLFQPGRAKDGITVSRILRHVNPDLVLCTDDRSFPETWNRGMGVFSVR